MFNEMFSFIGGMHNTIRTMNNIQLNHIHPLHIAAAFGGGGIQIIDMSSNMSDNISDEVTNIFEIMKKGFTCLEQQNALHQQHQIHIQHQRNMIQQIRQHHNKQHTTTNVPRDKQIPVKTVAVTIEHTLPLIIKKNANQQPLTLESACDELKNNIHMIDDDKLNKIISDTLKNT